MKIKYVTPIFCTIWMAISAAFAWSPGNENTTYTGSIQWPVETYGDPANIDSFLINKQGVSIVLDDARTYSIARGEFRSPVSANPSALYIRGATLSSNTSLSAGNNTGTAGLIQIESGVIQTQTKLNLATGSGSSATMTIAGGSVIIGTDIGIATGSASIGTLHMSAGSLTASSLTIAGGAASSQGSFIMTGGNATLSNLNFAAGNGASVGMLTLSGGSLTVSGTTTLAANGTGRFAVSDGSFNTDVLALGLSGKTSYLTVSNGIDFTANTINAGDGARITFKLNGGSFDSTAIIDTETLSLTDGSGLRLDLTDYAAVSTQTITLMSYAALPDTIVDVSIVGDYNTELYEVLPADWTANALQLTINYIPEPSVSSILLGLSGMTFFLRRRK